MTRISFKPLAAALAAAVALAWTLPGEARVTRIVIDSVTPIANQYEELTGRAFGELDPRSRHNELITDLRLAPRNAKGNVEYVASFRIRKPASTNPTPMSGVMWHDVPNRGGNVNFPSDSFAGSAVQLLPGWQGDSADGTAVPANASCLPPAACGPVAFANHYVKVPVLAG